MVSATQILVSGLPKNLTKEDIALFFGTIGVIKNDEKTGKPRIWIYTHRRTGEQKGVATVTYDDPAAAQSAIKGIPTLTCLIHSVLSCEKSPFIAPPIEHPMALFTLDSIKIVLFWLYSCLHNAFMTALL